MALHATINNTVSPMTLTVTADTSTERTSVITVTSNGESATVSLLWPVVVSDSSGHVWVKTSDDGTTAVYHY